MQAVGLILHVAHTSVHGDGGEWYTGAMSAQALRFHNVNCVVQKKLPSLSNRSGCIIILPSNALLQLPVYRSATADYCLWALLPFIVTDVPSHPVPNLKSG